MILDHNLRSPPTPPSVVPESLGSIGFRLEGLEWKMCGAQYSLEGSGEAPQIYVDIQCIPWHHRNNIGCSRKLGVPYSGGPYNKHLTI